MAEVDQKHPGRADGTRRRGKPSDGKSSAGSTLLQPKRLLAGLSWNTIGQFLVIGINLALTPFLLHRIGAAPYGVFALVSSARGLISNLDAGLAPTGYRYFPVYVGRGNVAITSSFLLTMLTLLGIIVGAETIIVMFSASAIAKLFTLGSGLSGYVQETAQLIRVLMPALFVASIRGPLQRLIMAHHRWAFINYTGIIAVLAYSVTTVVVSFQTSGLQALVWGTYAQEAVLFVTAVWACRRYVSVKGLRWLPVSEVRQILRFGAKIQIAAIASSFNYEIDALLVGYLFPVSYVAYYSIGLNFSQQVLNMPVNGLNPITQEIGHSFGRSGREGVLGSFADTQRKWVTALGVFPFIAALQGWFGISVWLGHGSQIAAASAAILILGSTPLLLNSIVDVTAKVVEMPEIESWYLGIGVIINIACTIPIALSIGVIGVPLGTAIGQIISFFVCIYLARRKIGKEITPFFWYFKYVPAFAAISLAGLCEWIFHDSMPTGGIGFVLSGLLTLPGFFAYYGWVYRVPLLQRFRNRAIATSGVRQSRLNESVTVTEEGGDGGYASRQMRGLQALMELGENPYSAQQYASRQVRGIQALIALAEPEVMTIIPFSAAPVRLRYTSPLLQSPERSLESPSGTDQDIGS